MGENEISLRATWQRAVRSGELPWRVPLWVSFIVGLGLLHGLAPAETQWQLMAWYAAFLILSTSISNTPLKFFAGQGAGIFQTFLYYARGTPLPEPDKPDASAEERRRAEVGFWTLMPSAFITCAR